MQSNQSSVQARPAAPKRRYRKKVRARQEAETRRRITEAVIELHRTVGPANTKVTEVAELAGVGRQTVYNHFPTEGEMIEASTTHWARLNPVPDPGRWAAIEDPNERLGSALDELYAWYADTEDMIGKILRDAHIVEPLGQLVEERWGALVEEMIDTLADGWPVAESGVRQLRATLRLAVDFFSWRSLRQSSLSSQEAAELAASCVRRAA